MTRKLNPPHKPKSSSFPSTIQAKMQLSNNVLAVVALARTATALQPRMPVS